MAGLDPSMRQAMIPYLMPLLLEWLNDSTRALDLEKACELDRTVNDLQSRSAKELEQGGICIRKLIVEAFNVGLFGKTILKLKRSHGSLPSHKFSTGDVVSISHGDSCPSADVKKLIRGVVVRIGSDEVNISIEEHSMSVGDIVRIDKLVDEITFSRIGKALNLLTRENNATMTRIWDMLITGNGQPQFADVSVDQNVFVSMLNAGQKVAVESCLSANDFAYIHGPPGTGKTTCIVQYILSEVERGNRVLAVAPSNVAVDNLAERLVEAIGKASVSAGSLVRLGHPARISESALCISLDALVRKSNDTKIVEDVRHELQVAMQQRSSGKRFDPDTNEKLYQVMKRLKFEIRAREEKAVMNILNSAKVVLSTASGAGTKILQKSLTRRDGIPNFFDVCVIDEVAQALEILCVVPAMLSRKLIVAGDHKQLAPTIKSLEAAKAGLEFTLADRIVKNFGSLKTHPCVVNELQVQYRMNSTICKWSSEAMYNNFLQSDDSVASRRLSDLPHVDISSKVNVPLKRILQELSTKFSVDEDEVDRSESSRLGSQMINSMNHAIENLMQASSVIEMDGEVINSPMLLIDTAGCSLFESREATSSSIYNIGEALLTLIHINCLLLIGIKEEDIAVLTPYNDHLALLSFLLRSYKKLEIKTIDGFQGQEKEVVIISMVRSSKSNDVGFLSDSKRMNVAVTRAKRHVALICDSDTVSKDEFLQNLVNFVKENGHIRFSFEYIGDSVMIEDKSFQSPKPNTSASSQFADDTTLRDALLQIIMRFKDIVSSNSLPVYGKRELLSEQLPRISPAIVSHPDPVTWYCKFNPVLSSRGRMFVHEIASNLGLSHESIDEGIGRFICLTSVLSQSPPVSTPTSKTPKKLDEGKAKIDVKPKYSFSLLVDDDDDQDDDGDDEVNSGEIDESHEKSGSGLAKEAGSSIREDRLLNSRPGSKLRISHQDIEDDESLLQNVIVASTKCLVSTCKVSVKLISVECKHCKNRFCISHGLPEEHGCGEAARMAARNARTLPKSTSLNEKDRAKLSNQLKSKIDRAQASRTSKEKKK
jgi:ATP-dependent RNA/DNA helicase IGHMBP2